MENGEYEPDGDKRELMQLRHEQSSLQAEIEQLRNAIPRLVDTLKLAGVDISSWCHIADTKLIPRLSDDFPLVVSICGGGSSGKSTLFNALMQAQISPTGGTAGINRRLLIAGNSERFHEKQQFQQLFEPFGFRPSPLVEKHDLLRPGDPLFVLNPSIPSNLILMDTPDFDTGAQGVYTNRNMAQQALELSDIFIYIFTNANYNNRDNTDFISQMLTGIGKRKCFLVYRVYGTYQESEISDHARTVAGNIYGRHAEGQVLGVFRADEDNKVAADEKFMDIRPLQDRGLSLLDSLTRLDSGALRIELLQSILQDVLLHSDEVAAAANLTLNELYLYRDALQTWQSHCVHEALQHFPMDIILKRFTEIWLRTDPAHVRWMRKAGDVIELPFKAVLGTVKWLKGKPGEGKKLQSSLKQFSTKLEEDLLLSVNNLWRKAVNPEISVSLIKQDPVAGNMLRRFHDIQDSYEKQGTVNPNHAAEATDETVEFFIQTHPVVMMAQQRLRSRNWQDVLSAIMNQKERIVHISETIDRELEQIVVRHRSRMNFLSSLRQTFSALLNVLPATVAVSYILTTGDPVGAVGIKVKLTGLFGLKDLYALVAIPATTGMKKADQAQLEDVLAPIAKSWLEHKLQTVRQLFEEEITGSLLATAAEVIEASEKMLNQVRKTISNCRKLAGGRSDGS